MTIEKILNYDPEIARNYANSQLDDFFRLQPIPTSDNVLDALCQLQFAEASQGVELDFATLNLTLDPLGCLGRTTVAAAYVERYFPETSSMAGDVIDDFFWEILSHNRIQNIQEKQGYLEEILMYEDPHTILLVDDQQFDPLSNMTGMHVHHRNVEYYPVWDLAYSSMLCGVAGISHDVTIIEQALARASQYVQTIEVLYQKVRLGALLDNMDMVVENCDRIIAQKPSARALLTLYSVTGNNEYKDRLVNTYTESIFELIKI
jgi:hypothetical protein